MANSFAWRLHGPPGGERLAEITRTKVQTLYDQIRRHYAASDDEQRLLLELLALLRHTPSAIEENGMLPAHEKHGGRATPAPPRARDVRSYCLKARRAAINCCPPSLVAHSRMRSCVAEAGASFFFTVLASGLNGVAARTTPSRPRRAGVEKYSRLLSSSP